MVSELHEKRGKNIINFMHWYNSRNFRVAFYKLIQKFDFTRFTDKICIFCAIKYKY